MSSVPRSSRAINSNVQFFLATGNVDGSTVAELQVDIDTATANGDVLGYSGSVLNVNGAFTIGTDGSALQGALLRDMGKTLYVQDNGKNVQIYKLVQEVNGNFDDAFYAKVWDAAGTGVLLVRTGY